MCSWQIPSSSWGNRDALPGVEAVAGVATGEGGLDLDGHPAPLVDRLDGDLEHALVVGGGRAQELEGGFGPDDEAPGDRPPVTHRAADRPARLPAPGPQEGGAVGGRGVLEDLPL